MAGLVAVILLISSFAFIIYQNNKANKKQLALNYWNSSQSTRKQDLQLTGLHYAAEAISLNSETDLTKNILILKRSIGSQ